MEGLLVGRTVVHIDQRVLLEHGWGILPREDEHLMVRCRRFNVRAPGSLESALMETVDVPWYPVEIRHLQRECVLGVTLEASVERMPCQYYQVLPYRYTIFGLLVILRTFLIVENLILLLVHSCHL